jgi:hypothetical protein
MPNKNLLEIKAEHNQVGVHLVDGVGIFIFISSGRTVNEYIPEPDGNFQFR